MSSQSGEFSCVEMSWEESSTKCKSYYGIVEEPRDERIIPIKFDRSLSIHTASDEEEEPFWVVESVKKHEEVRNEIKKMKENKIIQTSFGDNYDEDDDNSLIELLKRVQKQRNDLEDILEKENQNINTYEVNRTDRTISRSNSMLSESSTLKARSVSRLSSLEENLNMDDLVNESNFNSSTSCTKNKIESFSIENISKQLTSKTTNNLDTPKNADSTYGLPTNTLGNNSEYMDKKYSKHEGSTDRVSVSRLSSIEEYNNSIPLQKNIKEFSEKSKRPSLSKLPSNKYTRQDSTLEKSISPIIQQEESNKNSIFKSLPRDKTEEYENKPIMISNMPDDKFKTITERNLNMSMSSGKNDYSGNINDKPNSYYTKAVNNDMSNEPSSIQLADEADFRRKSLIRQSSMLSDALSAMCTEIPDDNKYSREKRLSIKEDNKLYDRTLKEKYENDLLIPLNSSNKSFDEGEKKDSLSRKSSISKAVYDENTTQYEKKLTTKLDVDRVSEINNELYDSLPTAKQSETSNTEPLRKLLHLELNQNNLIDLKNSDLTTIKADSDLSNGTLDNNSHISDDVIPRFTSDDKNKSVTLDKETELNNEQRSESVPKDSNLGILTKESISSSGIENYENDLQSNGSTNTPLSLKKEKYLEIPIKETVLNKEEYKMQPSSNLLDKENGDKSILGTKQKEDIEINKYNINTNILPTESLPSNDINNSQNEVDNLNYPLSTKKVVDTKILNMPLEKHLVDKENDINYIKTANTTEKVNKMIKEHSPDCMNKENENISKLRIPNTSNEENYDKSRNEVKQIGGIKNIRCY